MEIKITVIVFAVLGFWITVLLFRGVRVCIGKMVADACDEIHKAMTV